MRLEYLGPPPNLHVRTSGDNIESRAVESLSVTRVKPSHEVLVS